ncbi:MAG: hypothetical protein P4L50_09465 [Anaerolineaceae bacterium]|nr:hypothetical protein [Anaerolineaceae bacterium]
MIIILSRLKALWAWLGEWRYVWASAGIIILALVISTRPNQSEFIIRFTGLILQLLGLGTVIWGISETRALFGLPSFKSQTKDWFTRFPLLHRQFVLEAGFGSYVMSSGKVRMRVIHNLGPNPTIKKRLEVLEKDIASIYERIDQIQDETDKEFVKGFDQLKQEELSRQGEDSAIREKLEATGTGGVHISLIGAFLIGFGLTLSTLSIEIAKLIKIG